MAFAIGGANYKPYQRAYAVNWVYLNKHLFNQDKTIINMQSGGIYYVYGRTLKGYY